MYEPIYLPKIENALLPLTGTRFGICHSKLYQRPDDPLCDPPHIHEYLEIFFNVSGDVSFFVGGSLHPVQYGEAVVSRAGEVHVCTYNKPSIHEHFCLWIDERAAVPLLSFLTENPQRPVYSFDAETQKSLCSLFYSLEGLCEEPGSDLEKTLAFLQIMALMQKRVHAPEEELQMPEIMRQILLDIHDNFMHIRQVNDILQSYFISPATLNRWFRKYLHLSPREYIESRKLSHAAKLLTEGATVTEACIQSGFCDCSHFILLFKKKYGMTPLRYKKRWLGAP